MSDTLDTHRTAVLLMAYGGPTSLDEVGQFMLELTGREPSDETLARVRMRYLTIGGASPLPEMAVEIATELEAKLAQKGRGLPVAVGFRYCCPRISETLKGMYDAGVREVVAVSLSPYASKTTTDAYRAEYLAALRELPEMTVLEAPLLYTLPAFVDLHAIALAVGVEHIDVSARSGLLYVMTAHSLPIADLTDPDPYVHGLRKVADRIAEVVMLGRGAEFADEPALPGISAYGNLTGERPWLIAYQSRGERPGEWLGPDLDDVIEAAAAAGRSAIVVVPIGFAVDHMETLYDLDVVAAGKAMELGMEWARSEVPNADDRFIDDIADVIVTMLADQSDGAASRN